MDQYISILNGKLIKDKKIHQYIKNIENIQLVNNLSDNIIASDISDTKYPSTKAVYNAIESAKSLGLIDAAINQILKIDTVDENGIPKSYTTLDIADDSEVDKMIAEVLNTNKAE